MMSIQVLIFALLCSNIVQSLDIGKQICIEGYVMDLFCIERGTLLDNPRVRTLEEPNLHSYHCLLDVTTCVNSGYEILLDPIGNETMYTRGVRLDNKGNELVIQVGRAHGFCSTCNGQTAQKEFGFRAIVTGKIIDMGSSESPPTLAVNTLEEYALSNGCPENFTDVSMMRDEFVSPIKDSVSSTTSNSFSRAAYIHGGLMLIGWGWLLPSGALFAKFFKHHDPLWFHIHRGCQVLGMVVSIAGFIVAIVNFDAFGQKGYKAYNHAIMGCVVMALGFFQPLNAAFRPHKVGTGESQSMLRTAWEITHKASGWIAIMLASITIGIGTTLLPANNRAFQAAYGIGAGGLLIVLTTFLIIHGSKDSGGNVNDENV